MRRAPLLIALAASALLALAPAARAAEFGYSSLLTEFTDSLAAPETRAGAHPHLFTTEVRFNTEPRPPGAAPGPEVPVEPLSELLTELPVGLVGNPTAVPTCSNVAFNASEEGEPRCGADSQVGEIDLLTTGDVDLATDVPVYNLTPLSGQAARLGFQVVNQPIVIDVTVSPEPPYNILANATGIYQAIGGFEGSFHLKLWGNPADPVHGSGSGAPELAYLTLPRSCGGPLETIFTARSWVDPEAPVTEAAIAAAMEDCAALDFNPEPSAAPTTDVSGSPSGFDFQIEVKDPGLTDPEERADSDLKKAVVTLPVGMTVNPAAAGGLEACSQADFAGETVDSDFGKGCPAASRVASVEVSTPLLEETLNGSIFLATPHENPLGELLAGYLVIRNPERGILVKLTGKIEVDPQNGQISASFDENPQFPFELLEVSFPGGPRASLTTPLTCGVHEVRTELHPWSGGPADVSTQPFEIKSTPSGGPCPGAAAAVPNTAVLDAGTVTPIAAVHSPFVLNLTRPDGSQRFSEVRLSPPPGLVAKLAGVPYCPEAALAAAALRDGADEQSSPSCPQASRLGSVFAAAGSGPAPFWAPGTAYLAGPYKGAPLSVAIVTPAVAGPFDLGVVVIRTALHVNPRTAQITAVSDPIPEFLQGIPLDVRVAQVRLDRPEFTLNPTSCEPMTIEGLITSTQGALASLANRFQVAECRRLGFKPRISLQLFGGVRRGAYQGLRAVVRPRPGDANIGRTAVRMPRTAFLAQEHIRTVCTRVQFAADTCPKGSIYGTAIAYSPLLDHPLEGSVYLRSSDNPLPDLVADLRGPAYQPIRVELVGRTDSVKGALRNTFDVVPDAPVSYFRLQLFGGERGLIVNSRNICLETNRAAVSMNAQNGRSALLRPVLFNSRCKKHRQAKQRQARTTVR